MEITIREITNKETWEHFLLQCPEKTFLQSWNWGEFQIQEGNDIWRFGIFFEEKLLAVCLAIKVVAKRGIFLFVPHGPVIIEGLSQKERKEIFEMLLHRLKEVAKEHTASFIRFSPIFENIESNELLFSEAGFGSAPIHMHPETTWELDISLPEEDILSGMRKTTRYLIRQAEKNTDIVIEKSTDIRHLEIFEKVYQETAKRQKFSAFPITYLKNEFEVFDKDKEIMIFLGKYKGEVVSVALFVFWQNRCFYHHSGSVIKYKNVPVSYLLQWEAMKEAKKRSCILYNFWGIAPKTSHPWAGLSLFKMGFGGYRKEYITTKDFILSKKYWINYCIEKIRSIQRGYH